jgi:undecaprenyl-diphosphatase
MIGYGLGIYMGWRFLRRRILVWGLVATWIALVIVICFSRVYLRAHYLSDVIAGFALGMAWLTLCCWGMECWIARTQPTLPSGENDAFPKERKQRRA